MSNKQRLVLSIIDFLNHSIEDGTVKQDDKESLEVAIQCIGEAFDVDPSDEAQRGRLSVQPATLPSIFDVFLKTRDKLAAPTPGATAAPAPTPVNISATDKELADKFKAEGNAHMSAKKYDAAIESYTNAITLDPTNPVYYSNRAAAYSSKNAYSEAVLDAEHAIEVDANFVKAYHRLGHAHYSLGHFKEAASAFRRGLEIDPSNASLKSGLKNAEARMEPDDDDQLPPLAGSSNAAASPDAGAGQDSTADMLRNLASGGGAGGAGGGMPDLASIMSNPIAMQMAQQLMQNGGVERLMQNPALANLMNSVQSGNMPSMAEIMSDPSLRDLASQFGAGGARQ